MFSTQRKMPAKRMPPEIRVVQKRRGKRQFNFKGGITPPFYLL
jgi:hypothetical protein